MTAEAVSASDDVTSLIDIDADDAARTALTRTIVASSALRRGHFALHRERHALYALRFRGMSRDAAALDAIAETLVAPREAPMPELHGAKLLAPESSGFLLGQALAKRCGAELVIAQTDLHRLPTNALLVGALQPNDRVVLVNDFASTGASLEPLRQLVAERGAIATGVMLFGVVNAEAFARYCTRWQLPARWLVTARWEVYAPDRCPACQRSEPLVPMLELA